MQKLLDLGILKEKIEEKNSIPWISHIVILFTSLLSGLGIIALLGIMGIINKYTLHIFGMIAIIFVIIKKDIAKESIQNYYFLLMTLIAGEIGFIVGLVSMDLFNNKSIILLIVAMLQIPLFIFIDDYLQRIFNITIFTISIYIFSYDDISHNNTVLILFIIVYTGYIIYITFNEQRFFNSKWFYQIKDAFIINIFILLFFSIFNPKSINNELSLKIFFAISVSLLAFYTLNKLLTIYRVKKLLIYPLILILLIAFYPTPALIVTFIILALSSYQKNYLMMITSLIITVIFIGYWYYSLEFSLLYKSISMMFIGLLMLFIYHFRSKV